jgi:hypothetical protein
MGGFSVPLCVLLCVCTMLDKKRNDQKNSPWTSGLNNPRIVIPIPWLWQIGPKKWCLVLKMATYTPSHTCFLF